MSLKIYSFWHSIYFMLFFLKLKIYIYIYIHTYKLFSFFTVVLLKLKKDRESSLYDPLSGVYGFSVGKESTENYFLYDVIALSYITHLYLKGRWNSIYPTNWEWYEHYFTLYKLPINNYVETVKLMDKLKLISFKLIICRQI